MSNRNLTLLTDLYQLTMMQGYFKNKAHEVVIFDLFYRKNPSGNGYAICCGLEQAIDYIKNLNFSYEDIEYLRSLGIFTLFLKVPLYFQKNLLSRLSHLLWKLSL